MDYNKALKILEGDSNYKLEEFPVFKGMQIISRYLEHEEDAFEHDQIWYGGFTETIEKMTEQEVKELRRLGWFESEDSWSHF